ncbi:MAG: FtsW/RodA/SpoVE family cell cycle protein [Bacilli bacterium]
MKRLMSKMDKPLLYISIILFTFGVIMVLSASNMEAFVRYNISPYHYFFRQLFFIIIGIVAFRIIINIPTSKYKNIINGILIGAIIVLVLLFSYGSVRNASGSWLGIGTFGIQPSEFSKIILIIYMGTYYENNKDKLNDSFIALKPLLIALIFFFLVLFQPDLGTAIIIALLVILIFSMVRVDTKIKKTIKMMLIGGIILGALIVTTSGQNILSAEQKERLNFLDPCSLYETEGYQVCNGYIAINNGSLLGVGLGNSTQKYLYLPEAHTDFIFAIIMEETGLLVALIIISLYVFILMRIIRIGNNSHTIRGKLISYGIACYIFLHIAINLSGLFGITPYTGVPLPFLSYGGSFVLSLIVALAIVERIAIENKNYQLKIR